MVTSHPSSAGLAGVVVGFVVMLSTAMARPAHAADAPGAQLSLQVWALEHFYDFELTAAQLKTLRAAAEGTADPRPPQAGAKVPAAVASALAALRDALVKGDDADHIDELRDALESAREDDPAADTADDVVVTDAARAKVPQVIKMLAPSQVAGYLARYQDEVPDPLQSLMDAADEARGTDAKEFDRLTAETAEEVAGLLAGLDPAKVAPVDAKVKAWLGRAHGIADAEYQAKRGELEQAARDLVGDADPFVLLRHWVERDLAELLSNPQLTAAIDARLKAAPAAAAK